MSNPSITMLVCSYNTPVVTMNMLKSFYLKNSPRHDSCKILISDNSTDNLTTKLLDRYKIPYLTNPGASHSEGMNILFERCETDYAVLVDTDIIFKHGVEFHAKNRKVVAMGEIHGPGRGGKNIRPRLAPHFCVLNVDVLKKNGISFNDMARMTSTEEPRYDVGSSLLEDINKLGDEYIVVALDAVIANKLYKHYEGMSWRINKFSGEETNIDTGGTHNNRMLYNHGLRVQEEYDRETKYLESVELKPGWFVP